MEIKFTVLGAPVAKGRPRMTRQGHTYTPQKTVAYENLVRLEYQRQCGSFKFGTDAPLDVRITAYYPIPKSVSKKKRQMMVSHQLRPMKRPDTDNVCKSILDSLNGVAYYDDAQVVDCQVRKFYGEDPRVFVKIISLEGERL